jgi:hypothetical protein
MCRLRLGVLCGWSPAEVELDRERQAGFSRANFRVACYHLHRRPHQRPGFARRPAPTRTRDASTKLLPFGANDICQPRADLTAISCAAAALTVCRLAAASIRGASARTGGAVTCAAAGRDSGSVFGGVLLVGHRFLLVSFSASCALKRADVHRPETLQCPRHKQKKTEWTARGQRRGSSSLARIREKWLRPGLSEQFDKELFQYAWPPHTAAGDGQPDALRNLTSGIGSGLRRADCR